MYNDYWLEEINDNIIITNTRLNEIKNIQQQMQVSGDNYYNNINNKLEKLQIGQITISCLIALFIIYNFVVRCFK